MNCSNQMPCCGQGCFPGCFPCHEPCDCDFRQCFPCCCVQGPKGDTGAQGPKGDTGAQGPKGDIGAQGPKGDTGTQGPKGDTGAQGPKGDKGDQGEPGVCNCTCRPSGELVTNPGMEIVDDGRPAGWTFVNPDGIHSVDAQGRVHSGNWAVNMRDGARLEQIIRPAEAALLLRVFLLCPWAGRAGGVDRLRRLPDPDPEHHRSHYHRPPSGYANRQPELRLLPRTDHSGSRQRHRHFDPVRSFQ